MSFRSSESENSMESEDLNEICHESTRKIAEADRQAYMDRGGSLDRLKNAMKNQSQKGHENQASLIPGKFSSSAAKKKPIELSFKESESTKDESKTSEKSSLILCKNPKIAPDTKKYPKQKTYDLSKKPRVSTPCEEYSNKRPSAFAVQNKLLYSNNTILKVEGAFSKKLTIRKETTRDAVVTKKLEKADAYSDDENDVSVETVKKQSNIKSATKKKIRHKLTVCLSAGGCESGLVRHFMEAGEWKKVATPEEAVFTYVINERKLDWDLSLKTMVGFN